jgi:hypothetical protein
MPCSLEPTDRALFFHIPIIEVTGRRVEAP